jgi:hypothetical protein
MRRQWRLVGCAPGLLAMAVAGCGPGHGLTLGRVSGKVTAAGEPVRYGTVFFVPDTLKGTDGPSAMGIIQDDGTYTLSTDSGGDGALVGHHKVGVVGLDPTPINKTSEKPLPNPEEAPQQGRPAGPQGPAESRRSRRGAGGHVHRPRRPDLSLRHPQEAGQLSGVRPGGRRRGRLQHHQF